MNGGVGTLVLPVLREARDGLTRHPALTLLATLSMAVSLYVLGMFLLGLWSTRRGIALAPENHRPFLVRWSLIGWSIGLRFTQSLLVHVARAFPRVLTCMVVLILLCGALAALLVLTAGVDPLTAYLATSPGGMDSVAIIAASSKVDVSFVMALQTVRLAIVLIVGPPLARFISQRMI